MPTRTTPTGARPGAVAALLAVFAAAGLATASPALAVDDPTRPDAQVTHGPSCQPGGVVVEVTAGSAPYSVRLSTTRQPAGEDEAVLEPAATVVLSTGDVDWGETIDSRLEYTALDGSGTAYVDDLENYSFTRPTEEDCAAIAPPPPGAGTSTAPSPAPSSAPAAETGVPDPGAVPAVEPAPDVAPSPGPHEQPAPGPQDTGAGVAPPTGEQGGEAQPVEGPMAAQVAPASETRALTSWPLFFAALSLLATGSALLVIAVRRWSLGRRLPTGSA